ncbi:hypothetical protein TRIATDRAFT_156157 [Trichoderma atroviride IMI 206040]|uniref:BTB domain-containing protein n=1 Tax=Hypocrea atroviridis (strain ATCC 20476 / IMI 206040) TaxID=452589 RepID=G9NJ82_HYPAI|nr:uncharacterized protein TRIATDRAFT_156157 [Trichoderma atroviride IMI 206040]EHK48957.1 hypothetical protein TRIATDRAFT_156157 [Trichoderma atroviride IMI 206040]
MGESAAAADAEAAKNSEVDGPTVVNIAEAGDIILDVTFETSKETLKKSQKASALALKKPSGAPQPALKRKVTVAYRVSQAALKKHSQYFANLLSNPKFSEASAIDEVYKKLAALKIEPGKADAADLPWIRITDDDEATKAAGREHVFEDMLKIIHQKPLKAPRVGLSEVTTMAILADRFDCLTAVARSLNGLRWPVTNNRPFADDSGRNTDAEQTLREKILVSWLLSNGMKLHQAARELVVRGSRLWSDYSEEREELTAAWWHLPEGIEEELKYRRECVLNTIASVQRHFLNLYCSKERQCKLGYDSSGACDSFQLGQMLKFLVSKNLLFLVDYTSPSLEAVPDGAMINIDDLLNTLKQCPNYQIDKHHTNCGLKIRMDPITDYIRTMLSASGTSIAHADWKKRRSEVSWTQLRDRRLREDEEEVKFVFTRAVASDQRLRYEAAMYTDRLSKGLFTASSWDWTPEA